MGGFDALIYTDCRPGQGLSGRAGLQFQASSGEVDQDAMSLVQRHLLYEPPSKWMREQRPADRYPRSFAHLGGDYLITACGTYLGREANGTREGNQLTHAIVTRDPHAYGPVRPAQLFGAPFWTSSPAGTTRCDPVGEDPTPGPLDAETVQAFVRAHADGQRLLATLVSVLSAADGEQPQGEAAPQERVAGEPAVRVLFIADQPEPVLTWLAAATLLLPQRQALGIGFKIFTANPMYSPLQVLAVHPDWDCAPASVERPQGYVVVDLLAGRWTEVPVTRPAAQWAELFCAEDPFDVTDAVEFASGSGLRADLAMSLALAGVLHRPPPAAHAEPVVSWLTSGPPDLVAAYGAAVAAVVAADVSVAPLPVLRALDRATRTGDVEGQAVPVRLALLAAEVRRAAASGQADSDPSCSGRGGEAGLVPAVSVPEWSTHGADLAHRAVVDGLRAATGPGFAAVLEVAVRYQVPVRAADGGEATDAFFAHWADHPDLDYRPARWPYGDQYVDGLRDLLCERLSRQQAQPNSVGDRWWRQLQDTVCDVSGPLDAALASAVMLRGSTAQRLALRDRLLDAASSRPDAADAISELIRCLWRRALPSDGDLAAVARVAAVAAGAPSGAIVDSDLVDDYVRQLLRDDKLTDGALRVLRDLVRRQFVIPGPATVQVLSDDDRLTGFERALPAVREHNDAVADSIQGVRHIVVHLHRTRLVDALLRTPAPRTVAQAVGLLPEAVVSDYVDGLISQLRDRSDAGTVTTAVLVLRVCRKGVLFARLQKALDRWVSRASEDSLQRVTAMFAKPEYESWQSRWQELLDYHRARRGLSRLRYPWGR